MANASGTQRRKYECRAQQRQHDDLFRRIRAGDPTSDGGETHHEHVGPDASSPEAEGSLPILSIQQIQDSTKCDRHSGAKKPDFGTGSRLETERRGHVEKTQGQGRDRGQCVQHLHGIDSFSGAHADIAAIKQDKYHPRKPPRWATNGPTKLSRFRDRLPQQRLIWEWIPSLNCCTGTYYARLPSNSAMRVCQPGPEAFHLASTVCGKRIVT
jgi:hypothetical protein